MSVEVPGYKIIRPIGRGGMATVYLAEQEIFERNVALKVMSRSLTDDPSFGQRFFREAKIVSRLVHPNIVTVHDVGEYQGHYYLSMEHIAGGDLKLARTRLTFRQKITTIKDIAKALQYASVKGYVHRDIKPENIMFQLADGRAVLTDFGIARAAEAEASVTQTGVAIGTPHYMSPEQAKGKLVDHRSDIYSLGVVLYLLLAGEVPYDAESAVAIGIKHITEPIPRLPELMEGMQPVVDKMMAKSPDDRYQTAALLIRALENLDLDKLDLVAQAAARDLPGKMEPQDQSPTLISRPLAVPMASAEDKRTPHPTSRPEPTFSDKRKPVSADVGMQIKPSLIETNKNQAIDEEQISLLESDPDNFSVIYADDSADSSKGYRWLWMMILLLAVGGGAGYFYMHPQEWQALKAQGQSKLGEFVRGDVPRDDEAVDRGVAAEVKQGNGLQGNGLQGNGLQGNDSQGNDSQGKRPDTNAPSVAPSKHASAAVKPDSGSSLEGDAPVPQPGSSQERNSDPTSPAPIAAKGANQEAVELRNRIYHLEKAVRNDSAFIPELVAVNQELLKLLPEDQAALRRLEYIRVGETGKIFSLIAESKVPEARKEMSKLMDLFPKMDEADLIGIEEAFAVRVELEELLATANRLFESNDLTEPEKENALAYYQQVLKIESENADAMQGIRKISNVYLAMAQASFEKKDIQEAERHIKKSLESDWQNSAAVDLLEKIRITQEKDSQLSELFLEARLRLENKMYFEPVRNNAFHFYASILEVNPENTQALSGMNDTLQGFASEVWALVNNKKFAEARSALGASLKLMPAEEKLKKLKLDVETEIERSQTANMPVIKKVLVGSKKIEDIRLSQEESIQVGQTVFVLFSYENFEKNSIVQAKLLDGSGNIEVAQTEVQVAGEDGFGEFRVNSPVGIFPVGIYSLRLILDTEILSTNTFTIDKNVR